MTASHRDVTFPPRPRKTGNGATCSFRKMIRTSAFHIQSRSSFYSGRIHTPDPNKSSLAEFWIATLRRISVVEFGLKLGRYWCPCSTSTVGGAPLTFT